MSNLFILNTDRHRPISMPALVRMIRDQRCSLEKLIETSVQLCRSSGIEVGNLPEGGELDKLLQLVAYDVYNNQRKNNRQTSRYLENLFTAMLTDVHTGMKALRELVNFINGEPTQKNHFWQAWGLYKWFEKRWKKTPPGTLSQAIAEEIKNSPLFKVIIEKVALNFDRVEEFYEIYKEMDGEVATALKTDEGMIQKYAEVEHPTLDYSALLGSRFTLEAQEMLALWQSQYQRYKSAKKMTLTAGAIMNFEQLNTEETLLNLQKMALIQDTQLLRFLVILMLPIALRMALLAVINFETLATIIVGTEVEVRNHADGLRNVIKKGAQKGIKAYNKHRQPAQEPDLTLLVNLEEGVDETIPQQLEPAEVIELPSSMASSISIPTETVAGA